MLVTFGLTVFAWIFFRAENIGHAISILNTIFSQSLFAFPDIGLSKLYTLQVLMMIIIFITIEWIGREENYAIERFGFKLHRTLRVSFYIGIILLIFMFLEQDQQFIYFQF